MHLWSISSLNQPCQGGKPAGWKPYNLSPMRSNTNQEKQMLSPMLSPGYLLLTISLLSLWTQEDLLPLYQQDSYFSHILETLQNLWDSL